MVLRLRASPKPIYVNYFKFIVRKGTVHPISKCRGSRWRLSIIFPPMVSSCVRLNFTFTLQVHKSLQRIRERKLAEFIPWGPASIQVCKK